MPLGGDEGRHSPGPDGDWEEAWRIDFSRADGTGGFVRLGMFPNHGVAWWWTYLVAPDLLVAVRDHEVPLPRGRDLEVRADGLWAQLVCETPFEHWSIGLEAFGVALSDPADGLRGEWGERVAVGLDLEWEECGFPPAAMSPGRYRQHGVVHGELLVGSERIPFEGVGEREHAWGRPGWGAKGGFGFAFAVADRLAGSMVISDGGEGSNGTVVRSGSPPQRVPAAAPHASWAPPGAPELGDLRLADLDLQARRLAWVAIPIPGASADGSALARALTRFSTPEGEGSGWAEWLVTDR